MDTDEPAEPFTRIITVRATSTDGKLGPWLVAIERGERIVMTPEQARAFAEYVVIAADAAENWPTT